MDKAVFTLHVRERMGAIDDADAERAIDVSLRVLAESCSRRLAEHLGLSPRRAATMLAVREHGLGGDASAVYARVARRTAVPIARALEELQAVAATVAETLDDAALAMAEHELLPSVAALLRVPERAHASPHEHAHPAHALRRQARPETSALREGLSRSERRVGRDSETASTDTAPVRGDALRETLAPEGAALDLATHRPRSGRGRSELGAEQHASIEVRDSAAAEDVDDDTRLEAEDEVIAEQPLHACAERHGEAAGRRVEAGAASTPRASRSSGLSSGCSEKPKGAAAAIAALRSWAVKALDSEFLHNGIRDLGDGFAADFGDGADG